MFLLGIGGWIAIGVVVLLIILLIIFFVSTYNKQG